MKIYICCREFPGAPGAAFVSFASTSAIAEQWRQEDDKWREQHHPDDFAKGVRGRVFAVEAEEIKNSLG